MIIARDVKEFGSAYHIILPQEWSKYKTVYVMDKEDKDMILKMLKEYRQQLKELE